MNNIEHTFERFIRKIESSVFPKDFQRQYIGYTSLLLTNYTIHSNNHTKIIKDTSFLYENSVSETPLIPYKDVLDFLQTKYKLKGWQISTEVQNLIPSYRFKNAFLALIPDVEDNIKMVVGDMESIGYFCAKTYAYETDNQQWIVLFFNPRKKFRCNDWVKMYGLHTLYHLTPLQNLEGIKKQGIVPQNTNTAYGGECRAFYFKDVWNSKENINMLKGLARGEMKYKNTNELTYAILKINASKLPNEINFHLDPNATGAVFTNDIILPQYIDFNKTDYCRFGDMDKINESFMPIVDKYQ